RRRHTRSKRDWSSYVCSSDLALTAKNAVVLVRDTDAEHELFSVAIGLLHDERRSVELASNIKELAIIDADEVIARQVLNLAKGKIGRASSRERRESGARERMW